MSQVPKFYCRAEYFSQISICHKIFTFRAIHMIFTENDIFIWVNQEMMGKQEFMSLFFYYMLAKMEKSVKSVSKIVVFPWGSAKPSDILELSVVPSTLFVFIFTFCIKSTCIYRILCVNMVTTTSFVPWICVIAR